MITIEEFLDKYSGEHNREEMRAALLKLVDEKNASTPVHQCMNINERVLRNLGNHGIHTVGDLAKITRKKFMGIGYIGRKKVETFEGIMAKFGLKFTQENP